MRSFISAFVLVSWACYVSANPLAPKVEACPGEGWTFHGDKCYKPFPILLTHQQALLQCDDEFLEGFDIMKPRLLQVLDELEQGYLETWLFEGTEAPGVWLGAKRSPDTGEFLWPGEKKLVFTQWAPDSPSNNSARGCLEMMSGLDSDSERSESTALPGDWHDVTCFKGNWAVCEKFPPWSVFDMVSSIVELRYEVRRLQQLENEM